MTPYRIGKARKRRWSKVILLLAIAGLFTSVAVFFGLKNLYERNLQAVNSNAQEDITFVVQSGDGAAQIAEGLHDKQLIRSPRAFTQYVRSNELGGSFKAGTYSLRQSYDVPTIVKYLVEGKVNTNLFTIFPGSNLDKVKADFVEAGFSEADVETALNPGLYADHPALVDKPNDASLEGFLYPDSYEKIAETTPQTIIRQSLDEMDEALTPEVRAGIAARGLNVYQGITLASIIEREVGDRDKNGQPTDNRPKASQVFQKRLGIDMPLESNATDYYSEHVSPNYDTYSIVGLPPGPISNVTKNSLQAVVSPAPTDYLYFVSGRDCITRFSSALSEHDALKAQHGIARPEDNCRG